jgi:hypothetical protein
VAHRSEKVATHLAKLFFNQRSRDDEQIEQLVQWLSYAPERFRN